MSVYSFEEALEASKEYFNGDELAATVWINKYALKSINGELLEKTPTDMHHRMAKEIARIENNYPNPISEDQIFYLLDKFKYIVPGGSSMAGIGNVNQIMSLSNCFAASLEGKHDSYGGIIKTEEELTQIFKRRGGCGTDLSFIRPRHSIVHNAALSSTGVVSIMEKYSNTAREVGAEGRRAALMISLDVHHPDALEFINAKKDTTKVTGANISIKLTDDFMKAVENNETIRQSFPVDSDKKIVSFDVNAKSIWDNIIHNAWSTGEPGVLYWDTILKESVPDCYENFGFKTITTNPCGEIPLCSYDSCRLMSLNLYSYVNNPFTESANIDMHLFEKHSMLALRIMDDIIDLEIEKIDSILKKINSDPEEEYIKETEKQLWIKIREKCIKGRRTGIGVTAEGDMLAALGLRYGTDDANNMINIIHKVLCQSVYSSSAQLAAQRGSFEIYNHELEKDNPFLKRLWKSDSILEERMIKYGRRNIACLTMAPTGTISIMTQTTSGIEPVFKPIYKRRRKINGDNDNAHVDFVDEVGDRYEEFLVIHPKFKVWMDINGYSLPDKPSQNEIDKMVELSPYYKATANDIDWISKVHMQGMIQKWIDHSISVTINLPNDATEETVAKLYREAWLCGCKGVTVYRDGCRAGILVSASDNKDTKDDSNKKRPSVINADVIRFKHKGEDWIAFVGLVNGRPYEIFTGKNDADEGINVPINVKSGLIYKQRDDDGSKHYIFEYLNKAEIKARVEGLENKFLPEYWNYAKLISAILRYEVPLDKVVKIIQGLDFKDDSINNWKNGVIRALKRYIPDGTKAKGKKCPKCGQEALIFQEGCLVCSNCGYSKCG